jgi:hypothetical protein
MCGREKKVNEELERRLAELAGLLASDKALAVAIVAGPATGEVGGACD